MEKKKTKLTFDGIEFDSQEELDFFWWCQEAQTHGFIERFDYHPESYKLSARASVKVLKEMKTKTKEVDKFLLHPHEYTPDFIIYATDRFGVLNHKLFSLDNLTFYIDVKGGFSIYNNEREFSLNQKWIWQAYGIFINKLVPKAFFKQNFCPGRAAVTKTGKPRKHYDAMPSVFHALDFSEVVSPPVNFIKTSRI